MEKPGKANFNQILRDRTLTFSIGINHLFKAKKISAINRPIVNQIIRSSSSVAANFRSATRARSDAAYFSKICIVTEEWDETQFWLEYLLQAEELSVEESKGLRKEADELIRLFTAIKKKMKDKLHK